MKSNFQKASHRAWALVLFTMMVLTTITASMTISSKVAKAEGDSIIADSNFASLASEETDTGWWIYDAQKHGGWANCAADITADGTGLKLDYTANNGGFPDAILGIQVPQWINVTAGVIYTFSFDVESTGVKGIKAIVVDGKGSAWEANFNTKAGTQTFTIENVVFDATETVRFLFALGWVSGDDTVVDVTISNVTMTAGGCSDYFILGKDNNNFSHSIDSFYETKYANKDVDSEYWDICNKIYNKNHKKSTPTNICYTLKNGDAIYVQVPEPGASYQTAYADRVLKGSGIGWFNIKKNSTCAVGFFRIAW